MDIKAVIFAMIFSIRGHNLIEFKIYPTENWPIRFEIKRNFLEKAPFKKLS